MTKMEYEEMSGGETQDTVPSINQMASPSRRDGAKSPPAIKLEPDSAMSCSGCEEIIFDKYYVRVDGRSWHENCVNCAKCRQPLSDSCYSKNRRLYCKECYKQMQYCHRCCGSISGEDLVMRVETDSYHVTCFLCDYCNRQLQRGDQFFLLKETDGRKICCKHCYDIDDVSDLRFTESGSEDSMNERDAFSPDIFPPNSSQFMTSQPPLFHRQFSDSKSGPVQEHLQISGMPRGKNEKSHSNVRRESSESKRLKRPRTILTTTQRRKFNASFEISQKPCRKIRETLASETGLTPRVVQVWFQNQRAKMKKITRRKSHGGTGFKKNRRQRDIESDSDNEVPSSPGSSTSASTPHHAHYYTEYQSPRSMQSTSPHDDNRLFTLNYHQAGLNHSEMQYDGYDPSPSSHPMDETQYCPPIGTHDRSPSHLETHHMLRERVGIQLSHADVIPHDTTSRAEFNRDIYAPQRQLNIVDISRERPQSSTLTTSASNPIDSLVYMQSNFFNTT